MILSPKLFSISTDISLEHISRTKEGGILQP